MTRSGVTRRQHGRDRPSHRGPGLPVPLISGNGYRRAFRTAGSGPVLLLIHGIGDDSSTWGPLLDDLARDHTVLAPDLLGHGGSDKPRGDYSVAAYGKTSTPIGGCATRSTCSTSSA